MGYQVLTYFDHDNLLITNVLQIYVSNDLYNSEPVVVSYFVVMIDDAM